jgi:hypothetical protein
VLAGAVVIQVEMRSAAWGMEAQVPNVGALIKAVPEIVELMKANVGTSAQMIAEQKTA